MIVRTMLIIMLLFEQAAMAAGPKPARPKPQSGPDPTFRDFIGTNNIPTPDVAQQMGIGWVRSDLPWPNIEPQKGKWVWGGADGTIKKVEGMGLQFLPMVGYTPDWAAANPADKGKGPAKNPQDWTDFVEQVVARYSAPPYNLRYFQVWNEPTGKSGFFAGNNLQYVDLIYLPAAQIIRKHHCFVVFGGWPASNPVSQLDQTLNYHNAWQWTDIVDVHYLVVAPWLHLCDEWVKSGKCRGVWQSELGYSGDVTYLPRYYLEGLYGALQEGWTDPDQYKYFWFTLVGSGADANNCLTRPGPGGTLTPTAHGIRLKVLNDVLGGGALSVLSGVSTQPPLGPVFSTVNDTALGFMVGQNRAVVALIVGRAAGARGISVQVPLPHQPSSMQVVSSTGDRRPITGQFRGGRLTVNVPAADLQAEPTCLIGYLQIDGI